MKDVSLMKHNQTYRASISERQNISFFGLKYVWWWWWWWWGSKQRTFLHILGPLDALLDLDLVGQMALAGKCAVQTRAEVLVS